MNDFVPRDLDADLERVARRSTNGVLGITTLFALLPVLGGVVLGLFDTARTGAWRPFPFQVWMAWVLWSSFCFFVVPAVHALARGVVALRQRLDRAEARAEKHAGG